MPGTGDMPYLFVVEFSRRIEMTHIGFTMVCHMLPHYATLSIIILFHLLCGSLFISIHIWSLKRHWLQSSSQIEQHKWNKWNILYIKKWQKKWILRYTFTSICIILLKKKNTYQRSYFPTQPYNRPVRMLYDSPVYGADHLPHVDLEVEERNWTTLM